MKNRILVLAASMFVIGTDGFVVAGVLGDIADRADVSLTAAGQLITVFALAYAVLSPVSASLFGARDRRTVLLGAMAVFVAGNVIVAASTSFPVLVAGRLVAAAGAASFTPTALMTAGLIAPEAERGRTLSYVASGLTIATVVGVPLGTLLGSHGGYQPVFWVIAAAGVVAIGLIAALFPALQGPPRVPLGQRLAAIRLPNVSVTLLVTLLVFVSAFTVYSYVGVYYARRAGISEGTLSWVLLAFGIGGAIGNLLGGRTVDSRGVKFTVQVSLAGLAASFALIAVLGDHLAPAIVLTFLWGISGWLLSPAQQHRLMRIGGPATPLLISLNSSGMYLGIGISGGLGAILIDALGYQALPIFGAIAALASLALVVAVYQDDRPQTITNTPPAGEPIRTPVGAGAGGSGRP